MHSSATLEISIYNASSVVVIKSMLGKLCPVIKYITEALTEDIVKNAINCKLKPTALASVREIIRAIKLSHAAVMLQPTQKVQINLDICSVSEFIVIIKHFHSFNEFQLNTFQPTLKGEKRPLIVIN